jgi:hypothetical protein
MTKRVVAGFEVFRGEGAAETVPLITKTGGSETRKPPVGRLHWFDTMGPFLK